MSEISMRGLEKNEEIIRITRQWCMENKNSPFSFDDLFGEEVDKYVGILMSKLQNKLSDHYQTWTQEQFSFAFDVILFLRNGDLTMFWYSLFNAIDSNSSATSAKKTLLLNKLRPHSKQLFDEIMSTFLLLHEIILSGEEIAIKNLKLPNNRAFTFFLLYQKHFMQTENRKEVKRENTISDSLSESKSNDQELNSVNELGRLFLMMLEEYLKKEKILMTTKEFVYVCDYMLACVDLHI